MEELGNKKMEKSFTFESLLKTALDDWPKTLQLDLIHFEATNRYSVRHLGEICDSVDEKYIGDNFEILHRTLNSALYIVIHSLAPTLSVLSLEQLKHCAVRQVFEKKLQDELGSATNLNWTSEDIELVKSYLVNVDRTK